MVVEGCLHASDKNRWYRQHARHAYLINDIYIGIPLRPAECFDLRGLSIPCISSAGIWIYLRAVGLLILYLLQMSAMSFSGISFHWLCTSCIIFCFFSCFLPAVFSRHCCSYLPNRRNQPDFHMHLLAAYCHSLTAV